jgi:cobalt-zinc-cadmium efflux system protein
MSHEHHHHHHDHGNLTGSKLLMTIILNVIITLSQVVGGLISGSLALLSDALHNFSDVMALVIVYVANRVAQRKPSAEKTFGYKRVELVAALFNGAVLAGIGVMLIIEAIHKFSHPEPVESQWVIGLAILSIVLNWVSVMLVASDAKHNSNVKAAYLHLLTDVMTSVAVLAGGIGMMFWQLYWLDPIITIIIAVYLILASWGLIKETSSTLMLFAPAEVPLEEVVKVVGEFPEIENIHHAHLWKLDDHEVHLEAHLDFKENLPLSEANRVMEALEKRLHERLNINHFTFQPEYERADNKALIEE